MTKEEEMELSIINDAISIAIKNSALYGERHPDEICRLVISPDILKRREELEKAKDVK